MKAKIRRADGTIELARIGRWRKLTLHDGDEVLSWPANAILRTLVCHPGARGIGFPQESDTVTAQRKPPR